jgi:hypothetical protein
MKTLYRVTLRRGPLAAPPVTFHSVEPAVQFASGAALILDTGGEYRRADALVTFGAIRRRPGPRVDSATMHGPGIGAGWSVTLERVRLAPRAAGVPDGR